MSERPLIGLGVIVLRENKVLMGERIGSHGAGTWCFPGGHLEFFEKWEDCAPRETIEEAGIRIKLIDKYPCAITEDLNEKEMKHYNTLFFRANYIGEEVRVMEPDKCKQWNWFTWNNLPEPLFLPNINLIKQGYNPFK